MHYHENFYVQTKAREREKIRTSTSNNQSDEHAQTDENNAFSAEEDVVTRLSFIRAVPDEYHIQKKNIPEHENFFDSIAAKTEF